MRILSKEILEDVLLACLRANYELKANNSDNFTSVTYSE